MRYTRLFTLLIVLCLGVIAAQAQDATPTVVIPTVDVSGSGTGNRPGLNITPFATVTPGPETAATTEVDPLATPGADTSTTPLTLPQSGNTDRICPALVEYQAVPVVCDSLVADEACVGQGTVSASPLAESPDFSFSQPGDRARLTTLSELTLQSLSTESGAWTVVAANLPLNTNDPNLSAPAVVTMLLIGDVSIANAGEQFSSGAATAVVLGELGINVRRRPNGSAESVWQLLPGEQVLASGRVENPEGRWIRITIPNRFEGTGWVFAEYLQVTGDADNLPLVTESSPVQAVTEETEGPEYGPMQSFNLLSGVTDSSCTGTPDSGLLLQTPNGIGAGSGAKLRVNGVEIVLNGTAFIQAQANVSLRLTVLEGEASVTANGSTQQATAVSQVAVTMGQNLEPVNAPTAVQPDTDKIEALPVDLLDRSFILDEGTIEAGGETTETGTSGSMTTTTDETEPVSTEPVDQSTTGDISSAAAQPTAQPTEPPAATGPCVLSAGDQNRNIRVSPDINASVSRTLRAGETIQASNVVRDAKFSTVYWFEVEAGFMRFDSVVPSSECTTLVNSVLPNAPQPTLDPTLQVAADLTATAQPTATPAPSITPGGASLRSSEVGEVCGQPNGRTASAALPAGAVDVAVGGTWTVSAGARVKVTVEGVSNVRNDYGDIFRIVYNNDQILLGSKTLKEIELAFPDAISFQIRVGASEGEFVILRAVCL